MSALPQASLVALAIVAEILLISFSVDARSLKDTAGNAWFGWLAYSGDAVKVALLAAVLAGLALNRRLIRYGKELLSLQTPKRLVLAAVQVAVFALFYYLTIKVFSSTSVPPTQWLAIGWLMAGLCCGIIWLGALAPFVFWKRLLFDEKTAIGISLGLAIAVFTVSSYTSQLWGPLGEATFHVSAFLLELTNFDVIKDIGTRDLGVGSFVVNIAAPCSGYEGIGLICAFTALYLYYFRSEFHFPRALLLFPIGIICIWLFNAIRIALLILIGHLWSPEVAVGGFHSQAGWLAFIVCALGILYLAHNSQFFNRLASRSEPKANINLAMATLIPVLALLAANLLVSAFSAGFDILYPLKVIIVATAIIYCWRHLGLLPFRLRWEPVIAGVVVATLWFLLLPVDDEYNLTYVGSLAEMPEWSSTGWLLFRAIGAIVLIPIAEELGFRAYLLCRLAKKEVITRGALSAPIWSVLVSSLLFGLLHNAWLAGTIAGIIYAGIRLRTDSLMHAIIAHSITNGLLFIIAIAYDYWHLL